MCFVIKMVVFVTYSTICILILSEIFAYSYKRRPSASWTYPDEFYDAQHAEDDNQNSESFNSDFFNTQDIHNAHGDFFNTQSTQTDFFNSDGPQKHRRQTLMPPPGFQKNRANPNNLHSGGFTWGDPRRNDDFYVFDAVVKETSTVAIPGMETTQSPCEDLCKTTFQYNPVCGSNGRTFYNPGRLSCAQKCGQKISLNHIGAC